MEIVEVEETATTEQVAGDTQKTKRKAGRPRKPRLEESIDPEKVEMNRQINALMNQVQVLTQLVSNQKDQTPQQQAMSMGLLFPPPPQKVARPEGVEFELTRKEEKMDETEIARKSIFVKTLPARADNPNVADPRYCVFCSHQTLELTLAKPKPNSYRNPNVAELYGASEISSTPTPDQEQELRKLHREHFREMENWATSNKIGGVRRSVGAMHTNLEAKLRGRKKDEVGFVSSGMRSGENYSISSAEENARREADYQNELRALARFGLRGQ